MSLMWCLWCPWCPWWCHCSFTTLTEARVPRAARCVVRQTSQLSSTLAAAAAAAVAKAGDDRAVVSITHSQLYKTSDASSFCGSCDVRRRLSLVTPVWLSVVICCTTVPRMQRDLDVTFLCIDRGWKLVNVCFTTVKSFVWRSTVGLLSSWYLHSCAGDQRWQAWVTRLLSFASLTILTETLRL